MRTATLREGMDSLQQLDVGQAANNVAGTARTFLTRQVDSTSTQLGERVSATADDLRRVATELGKGETVTGGADVANRGAELIDGIGRYLQDADGDQLIADLESFARERPWAVMMGALAAGFLASRVLKASSARRYHFPAAAQSAIPRSSTTVVDGATYAD